MGKLKELDQRISKACNSVAVAKETLDRVVSDELEGTRERLSGLQSRQETADGAAEARFAETRERLVNLQGSQDARLTETQERLINLQGSQDARFTETQERLINLQSRLDETADGKIQDALERITSIEQALGEIRRRQDGDMSDRLVHIEDKVNSLMWAAGVLGPTREPSVLPPASGPARIHFIRSIDWRNTGDSNCDPLAYFPELGEGRECVYHHWDEIRWNTVRENDWVILGGGGMFNCSNAMNRTINQLAGISGRVIAWSCGENRHLDKRITEQIDFSKFRRATVRDYRGDLNLEYLPCVSCMHPGLDRQYTVKRRVGIIDHKDFPIPENRFEGIERISNAFSLQTVLRFIGESETIVTRTWHGSYWAQLMNKKVILYQPWSTKFSFYKYQPRLFSGDLEEDIAAAETYPDALGEAREMNRQFCREVIGLIETSKE